MDDYIKMEKPFVIVRGVNGRVYCKKCKAKCKNNGELRIGKLIPNHLSDDGMTKQWFHVDCICDAFKSQKAAIRKINSCEDVEGWKALTEQEKHYVIQKLLRSTGVALNNEKVKRTMKFVLHKNMEAVIVQHHYLKFYRPDSLDNLMFTFGVITEKMATTRKYQTKTEVLQNFLIEGTNGFNFEGDKYLWIKMMLPSAVPRKFNLDNKQIIKLFAKVFHTDPQRMMRDLDKGDISDTIGKYFDLSKVMQPLDASTVTMQEVDEFLNKLLLLKKEDEQVRAFRQFCPVMSIEDLQLVIRLIKHDMLTNTGTRHILDALHPEAYEAFQMMRNLKIVVDRYSMLSTHSLSYGRNDTAVQLMTPITPMLADYVKSVYSVIDKHPEGMYAELKYDGERLQIHKRGKELRFFTRSLSVVRGPKINMIKDFVPKAFPNGKDFIIDSEIIFIDKTTGELMPFESLGNNRNDNLSTLKVCLFVFDLLYYNGQSMLHRPMKERRALLERNMTPIENHIRLTDNYFIQSRREVAVLAAQTFSAGLEGLIIKSIDQPYVPGKRAWLKIKKTFIFEGKVSDCADLVVLGAWLGSGKTADMFGVYLMGCFDPDEEMWTTVTKVHSGLSISEMQQINNLLSKLMVRANPEAIPRWLDCKKAMLPDYIALNPLKMPVWEISGIDFISSDLHTANNITIRFPKIRKIRYDKSPCEATDLDILSELFRLAKEFANEKDLFDDDDEANRAVLYFEKNLFDPQKKYPFSLHVDPKPMVVTPEAVKRQPNEEHPPESAAKKSKSAVEEFNISMLDGLWNVKIKIFKGEVIYFRDSLDNVLDPTAPLITLWKGKITQKSKEATIVIHSFRKTKISMDKTRGLYQRKARHVTYKWLMNSLKSQKLLPYQEYAVSI